MPDAEGVRRASDSLAEVPGHLARDLAQRHAAAVARVPDARVDIARVGALRVLEILGEPALPRRVLPGDDARDDGNGPPVELLELVRGPGDHVAHDADDEGRGGDHQAGIGREVDGHLDARVAGPHAHARGPAVGPHHRHGHGQDVGEEQRELVDVAVGVLLVAPQLERDVVVRAVGLEPDVVAGAPLPLRELVAHEADLLPEVAHDARGRARRQLDHGRDHLDHAAVEVHGSAGGELERAARPPQQGDVDEGGGILPVGARIDLRAVEHDVELGLHARDGHAEARGFAEGPATAAAAPGRRRLRLLFRLHDLQAG